MGFLLILTIPVLGMLKNVFAPHHVLSDDRSILIKLVSGEFITSGRNFERLLVDDDQWDFFYGKSIANDALRSVVPGFIYRFENSISWFNNKFNKNIVAEGGGRGFSYLAEGYINFGYIGIVIWYVMLANFIYFLYSRANRNILFFTTYLFMLPLFIYVQRGDISTIVSPFIKQIGLMLFFFYVLNKIFVQGQKRKSIFKNKGVNKC
jgi:hypothetical protein